MRDNHGKSTDEQSVAWLCCLFVLECNNAFSIGTSEMAFEAWRRRLLLIICEGDFTKDTSKVNVDKDICLGAPHLESWVS